MKGLIPCSLTLVLLIFGPQPSAVAEEKAASPQPLYVEVTGHFEDNPSTEGRTADYDGLYRIESVLASRPDSPAGCPLLVMDD